MALTALSGPWRFLLFDAVTFRPQAELVVVGDDAAFGEILNSPGAATFTIPLYPANSSALTPEMLKPPRAVFAVERNDVLVWAGPILAHTYNIASQTVTFACEGFLNYLRRRFVWSDLNYVNIDQAFIATALIAYAASWSSGDLHIDTSTVRATGVLRERHYHYYEHQRIGILLEQLSAVDNGFDFRLAPYWTAGTNSSLGLRLAIQYPAIGRDTGIVLDLNSNARSDTVQLDGSNICYVAGTEGGGTGETAYFNSRQDNALLAVNPRLEDVTTHGDVSEPATLAAYSQARLNRGSTPMVVPRVYVGMDMLGTFVTGDRVTIRADLGLLQIPGVTYRITAWEASPAADIISLTLAPLAVFTT